MDSILGDSFMNRRRMRPATLEYAMENYPRVIIGLKTGNISVTSPHSVDGNDVIEVRSQTIGHLVMTRGDFDKCKSIALQMTIPLFLSEDEQLLIDRVKVYVKQLF